MATEVQMPKLGQTMEEGTVETWLKKEGEYVTRGEPLFEVTTDKATLEVEAFVEGTLLKIFVPEGETVPVNSVIAYVGEEGEEVPESPPPPPKPAEAEEGPAAGKGKEPAAPAREERKPAGKPAPAAAAAAPRPAPAKPEEVRASPRAKRLAKAEKVPVAVLKGSGPEGRIVEADVQKYLDEISGKKVTPTARELAFQNNVDLRTLEGSGANGKITKEDVEAASAGPARPAVKAGRVELTAMRRIVADRMTYSKTTAPHFYLTIEVDMTNAIAFRKKINAENNSKVAYNDIIIKACADAYADVPRMNAAWADDHVEVFEQADIALAVAIEDGLMVPVVRDAGSKNHLQISAESQDLIRRARSKKLGPDDYEGGSLTVSNLGMYGIDSFVPIINPGQAAILGIGRIQEKAVVIDGGIHVRPMMTMTLSADHRIVNGAEAAEWLASVKRRLEAVGTEQEG